MLNKEIVFTWKNFSITVIISIMSIIGSVTYGVSYFQGSTDAKIEALIKEVETKPSNDVLLQYMNLQHERFIFNEKRLDRHLEFEDKRSDEIQKRIERIEELYLSDIYRSGGEKKK